MTGCALCDQHDAAVVEDYQQEFGSAKCSELVPYLWRTSGLKAHAHCAGFIGSGACPHCDAW